MRVEEALKIREIPTPSTPSSGYLKIYTKSNSKLYIKNSAGTETQIGAGAGLIIEEKTTAYTLQLTDADGVIIRMNSATDIDLTIPLNSSVAIPIGTRILIEQMGAGIITVVATSGVTINSSARKTWGQYSVIEIMKLGTDLWNVIGGSV